MKPIQYTAIALLSTSCLFSCKTKETVAPAEEKVCVSDSLEKMIVIDTAELNTVDDELKLSGEISFDDKKVSKVFPFSSGQVLKVNVSVGDKVIKGQILAVIRSADVSGNYSDLSVANNDVAIAKKQMDNQQSLFQNGIASEREFIEAKENYQKALTAASKISNQLAINGGGRTEANGTYVIIAPISGYVVEKKINEGNFIRADAGDNLFTVGDISDVWVWANVYETDIAKVKPGYVASITTLAYPDTSFTGVVDEVSNVLDPVSKIMKIRVKLSNNRGLLKPEMFANIVITNKEGVKAVAISSKAIVSENGKNYVVLYNGKCDLHVKEVEIMKIVDDNAYIKSGLQVGDKVIADNQVLLFKALTEK